MAGAPQRTPVEDTATGRRNRLQALHDEARGCERCPQLAANRTTVVFGAGDPDADLLFVGETPGQNEDRQGLPLVGASGRLLVDLLAEVGIQRKDVYIANVLKCRPPSNRDPLAEEVAHCRSYLEQQIELIQPRVVCSLGNFATRVLRGDPTGIKRLHGRAEVRTIGHRTVRLLPLFHPASALYQRVNLDFLREDLAGVPALLALPVPSQPEPKPDPEEEAAATGAGGADPAAGSDAGSGKKSTSAANGDSRVGSDDGDDPPNAQLGLF